MFGLQEWIVRLKGIRRGGQFEGFNWIFGFKSPSQSPENVTFICHFEKHSPMVYKSSKSDRWLLRKLDLEQVRTCGQVLAYGDYREPLGTKGNQNGQQFSIQEAGPCLKMTLVIILNEYPKNIPAFFLYSNDIKQIRPIFEMYILTQTKDFNLGGSQPSEILNLRLGQVRLGIGKDLYKVQETWKFFCVCLLYRGPISKMSKVLSDGST